MENSEEFVTVEMELTDEMAGIVKDTFGIEIEMLQGSWELLPDGRVKWIIKVNQEKGELIKQFILSTMFRDKPINNN